MAVYSGKFKKLINIAVLLLVLTSGFTISGARSAPVYADAGADLIVQSIALTPTEPAIDDSVTITVTIKNQGTGAAAQNFLVFYVDNAILGTVTVNPLQAGTMSTSAFIWKADAGSHTLKAIVDSTDMVAETNETNNTKTYAVTTRAADLIVQSITWSPVNPSRGDAVTFSVLIKNQGNANSGGTNMNLYIDGAPRGTQDIPAIAPGGTSTRTYTWVALAGQHTIKGVADELNNVKESNETNNEYSITYSTSPADLIIDSLIWAPLNPSKNDTVSINATVKNQGSGRADASHVGFFINSELKGTIPVGALETGASANATFTWKIQSDKQTVKAQADYYQNVPESDKNNNEKSATIATMAPDLAVTSIVWTPANAAVGDTVSFTATIKNLGGGRADKTHAAVVIDYSMVSTPDIPEIPANGEYALIFSWTATGGIHTITVAADYDLMLDETFGDNNQLTVTTSVIPADLIITTLSWSPADFAINDVVTFAVTVKNQGGGRAENFNVTYYMDNNQMGVDSIARLDSGASTDKTFTWKATNGRHTFRAVANENKYVTEDYYNNNENSVTVAPNMPDLAIDTVSWSPADIKAGTDITFDIAVKNLGTLTAGTSRAAYTVDSASAGYTDLGQIEAGGTVIVHFTWGALAGLHTINVAVDSTGKVTEIDETNNTKVISLPPPDLIVSGITWSPAGASTGDNVTLTATIKNQGGSRTQASHVAWYLDGAPAGTKDIPEIDAGGSIATSFIWITAVGKHKIKAAADVYNSVIESDEMNNVREADFTTLTADLTIPDISWIMESPLTDDKVNVTITVKNQGTGNAGVSRLKYQVDNTPATQQDLPAIPIGSTTTFTFYLYLKAGSHTVNAVADSNNKIAELDKTNNSMVLTFSTVVPDLSIPSITVAPITAVTGDNVTITVKVENQGRDKASNIKLALMVDGAAGGSAVIKEINLGATVSQDFTWKAVAGNHEIAVIADPDNTIVESNKTNNSKSRTITIEKGAAIASPATTVKPIKVAAPPPVNKGFVDSWWWLIMLGAAGLGAGAFLSMFKAFKKS